MELPVSKRGKDYTWRELAQAWVLENGAVWLLIYIRCLFVPMPSRESFAEQLAVGLAGSVLCVESAMLVHHFYASVVYKHIPYFAADHQKFMPKTFWAALKGWAQCNLLAVLLSFAFLHPLVRRIPDSEWATRTSQEFEPLSLFWKLLFVRLTADVAFYCIHRAEHHPSVYWLHKKHHRHGTCHAIGTNINFHFFDVILEGFAPVFVGLQLLELVFGVRPTAMEFNAFFSYVLYYETGSHAGKELPTVSYFPPLSFVTRRFGWDDDNVLFHDNHHALNNCNYGITQWCDRLMGSRNVSRAARPH